MMRITLLKQSYIKLRGAGGGRKEKMVWDKRQGTVKLNLCMHVTENKHSHNQNSYHYNHLR